MFDFQKEVVINAKSFDVVKKGETIVGFRVDNVTYKPDNVAEKTVYMTEAVDGKRARVAISLDKFDAAYDKFQVRIELGLDRDYRGSFGSVLYYFRKPIVLDFVGAPTIETLESACKKLVAANDRVLSIVPRDATDDRMKSTDSQVVLEAVDDYITIRKAEIVAFDCVAAGCNEMMEDVVANNSLNKEDNVVSFGTYEYLIHNLRLPTYANIRFASPAAVEAPVLGGKYVQYSFEYLTERRIGGLSVVGQRNVSSTNHTFFVLESIAGAFDEMLGKVGLDSVKFSPKADGNGFIKEDVAGQNSEPEGDA